jgi:hypothetical protein
MAAIETDGRVSVFTGADGKPTMPQLNADGSISTSPGTSPGNQPVTIADGANVTLGSKTDTAGATPSTANLTLMQRISGLWNTIFGTVTAPGGTPTAVVNVQQAGAMSGFDNTGTSITGATFVALPSHACHSVTFLGGSVPCDIETATNATYATGITLPGLTVPVLANSNEITLQPTSQVGSAGIISFQYNS